MNRIASLPGGALRVLRRNLDLLASFLLPTGLYSAILADRGIYPLDPSGKYTVFTSDLNNQYAQFYSYFDQALTGHGSLLFTWRGDGGMNFWPIVAYYLTSPFGLFTLFASDRRLPIMIAFITILKVGTAGFAMALFLRRFRQAGAKGARVSTAMVVVLSTGYALSAWMLVYAFNIMWLDALYLLPLVLVGIERLLARGRIAFFALAIGANLIIDFYTGAMICVFASMYALARYFGVREVFERRDFLRTAGRFAIGAAIGGLLSAAFIVPTYMGGLTQKTQLHADASVNPPIPLLSLLVRFFGGTVDGNAKSPNVAAGTLILVLVPLFFTVKGVRRAERVAFGAVLAFLVLAMEVKPLYVIMHGGQMPNAFPFRFAFLVTALLTFLAFRAWVGIDSVRQVKGLIASGAAWFGVLYLGRQVYPRVITPKVVYLDSAMLIFGTLVLAFALYLRVRPEGVALPKPLGVLPKAVASPAVAAVAVIGVLALDAGGSALLVGQKELGVSGSSLSWAQWYSNPSSSYGPALVALEPPHDDFFRAEGYDQNLRSENDGLRYGNFAFTHFSSLSSGKLHQAMNDLGFSHHEANVWSSHTGATLLTDALLGYRYLVGTTRENTNAAIGRADTTLVKTYQDTHPTGSPDVTKLYRIDNTLPVGFRLSATDLADFTKALPQNSPFDAQEQVFGTPGIFQAMCGSPTVTGDGLTVTPGTDGTLVIKTASVVRKDSKGNVLPYSGKIVWNCSSPGTRQVYLYAPQAFPASPPTTFVRLDGQGRPAPLEGKKLNQDLANIPYPAGYANGFQDLGTVQAGAFTVTVNATDILLNKTYRISADAIRGLDPAAVDARLASLRAGGVTDVRWNSTGLSATTTGDSAATVFFSVPTIPGWSVAVDGKTVRTTELLGAFTGVPVPAGTHRISFSFRPPGLIAGIGGSALGVVALGGVWWIQRRRRGSAGLASAAAGGSGASGASGVSGAESVHEDVLS